MDDIVTSLANEMDDVADQADSSGINMTEFDDFGIAESLRPKMALAMSHWETGCYHLHEGAKLMKEIAVATEGDPYARP